MHKLDPIERLPDGTLFRLTPGQPKLEQAILSPKQLRRCEAVSYTHLDVYKRQTQLGAL